MLNLLTPNNASMALTSASIQSALRLTNSELYASAAAMSQNSLSQIVISQRQPPPIVLKEPPTPPSKQRTKNNEDEEENLPTTSETTDQLTNLRSAPILMPQISPQYTPSDLNAFLPFIQPNLLDLSQQIAQQNCMQMAFQQSLNGTPINLSPTILPFQQQAIMNLQSKQSTSSNSNNQEPSNPVEKSIIEHIKLETQQQMVNEQVKSQQPIELLVAVDSNINLPRLVVFVCCKCSLLVLITRKLAAIKVSN